MPISSKYIIEQIKSSGHTPFTEQTLGQRITRQRSQSSQRSKKKNSSPIDLSSNESRKIHDAVSILNGLILKAHGGRYQLNNEAVVLEYPDNTNPEAVMVTSSGREILLDPRHSALPGDILELDVFDIKRHLPVARVKKIASRNKRTWNARMLRREKNRIIMQLVDISGEFLVTAREQDVRAFARDMICAVELTGDTVAGLPFCRVRQVTGYDDEAQDFYRIVRKHELPENYPQPWPGTIPTPPSSEFVQRRDFRKLLTVTIDGERAKDFDDALSLESHWRGGCTLYVHIADVSAYVTKGSELDREALSRGTSSYLGDKVIPMLPEELSNDLCSLRAGEDRLTMTAILEYDRQFNLKKKSFCRSLIKVDERLTYERAEDMIGDKHRRGTVGAMLVRLNELADKVREKRMTQGRIDLNLTDFELVYDNGRCTNIINAPRLRSHRLVEECMLSANEAVSHFLTSVKMPALYRVHEQISKENATALKQFLRGLGIRLKQDIRSGRDIQDIIEMVQGREYEHVINFIILRSMMQAYYGPEPLGHFGLGFRDYTHFTSPIRRYPDLIVHRCLKAAIDKTQAPHTTAELAMIGEQSSKQERVAQKAERDLFKLKSCRLMQHRVGEVFDVIVSGVSKFGIYVTLVDSAIEGMIPLRSLGKDYFELSDNEFSVTGKRSGQTITIGDRMQARLAKVDMTKFFIDFEPAGKVERKKPVKPERRKKAVSR